MEFPKFLPCASRVPGISYGGGLGAFIVPAHQAEREGTLKSYLRASCVPSIAFLPQSHSGSKQRWGRLLGAGGSPRVTPPGI